MPYAVFIIKPDGSVTKTLQPKAPTYEQQSKAVGGYIETVPYFTKLEYQGETYSRGIAFANEEGIIKGLPVNVTATKAWRSVFDHATTLCGDVIFYAKEPTASKTIASGDLSPKEKRSRNKPQGIR